jgi:hypothetical protein
MEIGMELTGEPPIGFFDVIRRRGPGNTQDLVEVS